MRRSTANRKESESIRSERKEEQRERELLGGG